MRLSAALLLLVFAFGAGTAAPARAESEAARAKRVKQQKKKLEEARRRAEKRNAEEKKRQEEKHRAEVKKLEQERRRHENHPAAPAPASAPAAAPIKTLPPFASGGAAAPTAPKKFADGATITATPFQQPPVQHASFVDNPSFTQSVATFQSTEQTPNQYYWHGSGGVNYVHYYTGGAHWYGFYVGPNFYWSRLHDSRWWWYDPVYHRWVYYHGGAWWWQNPASPQTLYVYSNGAYTPYAPGTVVAASIATAAKPGPVAAASAATMTAPPAPQYRSDVDAPAYALAQSTDSFALVIGVESYANLPKADFAARDAQAVRAHLESLGYPPRNTIVLTDAQAVRSSVQKYVETWLPKSVDAGSRVFVYFAGHGAPDPKSGQTYLMPWDADPKYLSDTGYPLKDLYAKLDALPAKQVVVALDACFSGAGGRSVLAAGTRPLVTRVDVGRGATGHLVVFAAASGDEVTGTAAGQGHGLFTYYFLKGLNGAAGTASGPVTVQSLYDYVGPNVADAARRDNRDQTPQLFVPPDGQRQMTLRDGAPAKKGG